jgi:hypothetical protein
MRAPLLFLFLSLFYCATSAQDGTVSSVSDPDGNVIKIGNFSGKKIIFGSTVLFNQDTTGESTDLFVTKYDRDGKLLWAVAFGGTGYDDGNAIETGWAGEIYLAGDFRSRFINFGTTTYLNSTNDGTEADIFIAKIDPSGNVIWANSAGGKKNDRGVSLLMYDPRSITLTGTTLSPILSFGDKDLVNMDNLIGLEYEAVFDVSGRCLSLVEKDAELKALKNDFQQQFSKCIAENKIKISCRGCEGGYFTVELVIDTAGKLTSWTILKQLLCGGNLSSKMKDCLLGYLQSLTYPPALRGKKIELNASRLLKC